MADDLRSAVSEEFFRGPVEGRDDSLIIDRYDAIRRGLEYGAGFRLPFLQRRLRLSAIGDLELQLGRSLLDRALQVVHIELRLPGEIPLLC